MAEDIFLRCSEETKQKYLSYPDLKREYQTTLGGDMEYVVIDLETTGFDPERDRIIEVAALRAEGPNAVERLSTLIDPGCDIPMHITGLTGIDDAMVAGKPTIDEFFGRLVEFIGDRIVVAHSRLEEEWLGHLFADQGYGRFGNPYIDTLDLAITMLPSSKSHRLVDLAGIWGVDTGACHRAGDDVETLFAVFNTLLNGLYNAPLPMLRAITDHAPAHPGGFSLLFSRVLQERTGGRQVDFLKLSESVSADGFWESIVPLEGTESPGVVFPAEVKAVFEPGGALASLFDDYEERDEQLHMAEAARAAFEAGEILLVEAGTGTGKSLAYLAPGVMTSKAIELPVAVSTRTLNLQDQLNTKDLPMLERALGERSFRYCVLKGYGNYLCLRKLQNLVSGRRRLAEGQLGTFAMLLNWVTENETGDVSLLNVAHLRRLDELVLANHRECPGNRCRYARQGCCFYRRALFRAKRSHVVVVNHSLLLAGIGVPVTHAVIDEAHTLEDVATEQFTEEVEYSDTRRFLESLYHPLDGSGFLADLVEALEKHLGDDERHRLMHEVEEAQEALEVCIEDLEKLFIALSAFYGRPEPGTQDVRFSVGQMETLEYTRLEGEGEQLEASLDRLMTRLARVREAAEEAVDSEDAEYRLADLDGKGIRAGEIKGSLQVLLHGGGDDKVRWAQVAHPDRMEYQSLRASPIYVGEYLKTALYEPLEAVVMTSATLTVKGSFDFFRSRVGLDVASGMFPETLVLDSSFDFRRQMQILMLHDMPDPNSEGYARELAGVLREAIQASGGGALVLFTNRRLMLKTYELLVDDLRRQGLTLLCQQPGFSRRRLAEEFVEDESASLFGTASFWEGVDARGRTLRLLVVTRIPFESPGRPVFEARSEQVRLEGGSDFMELSLPLAALKLKQGVGRLIRTRQDRGQVLLLDSRIHTKKYGQVLLRSLPEGLRRRVPTSEIAHVVRDFQEHP
ncbi:MAG: helicase C-terminal domain-containing protein [Actinomycetota bacterium]